MMQRTHYNAIAAALRSGGAGQALIDDIADALLDGDRHFDVNDFTQRAVTGVSMETRTERHIIKALRIMWPKGNVDE